MAKYYSHVLIVLGIIVCIAIGVGLALASLQKTPVTAVGLQDGRILIGFLNGNELCSYRLLSVSTDPKTKQKSLQASPGGAVYGGDGCLTVKEQILWTEKLLNTSPLYSQVSGTR